MPFPENANASLLRETVLHGRRSEKKEEPCRGTTSGEIMISSSTIFSVYWKPLLFFCSAARLFVGALPAQERSRSGWGQSRAAGVLHALFNWTPE
jgi:hypothetical protein